MTNSEPSPSPATTCSPPPPLPQAITIRSDLILTAVNFLKDPQVKSAPLSKRLAFLEGKGLTAEEIDLALVRAGGRSEDEVSQHKFKSKETLLAQPQAQSSPSTGYKGLILTTAIILGTGSLLISNYDTIKSFAARIFTLPRTDDAEIKRVESELKQSIRELKDLIEEKERKLHETLITNQNK